MSNLNKEIVVPILIVIVSASLGFSFGYLTLEPQIQSLDASLTSAQDQIGTLDATLASAQESDVSASLQDDRLTSYYEHRVSGIIINFGTESAENIVITAKWFKEGTSFHQEIITVPSLEGRSIKEIDFTYSFEGRADELQYTIVWE